MFLKLIVPNLILNLLRILGKRIAELERRLGSIGDGAFPSKALLNGYSVTDIDKEVDQILAQAEEKNDAVPDSCTSDTSECSEGIVEKTISGVRLKLYLKLFFS